MAYDALVPSCACKNIVYAAQFPGDTADAKIDKAIASTADCAGPRVIVIGPDGPGPNGTWVLQKALELPSLTTLLLIGAQMSLGRHEGPLRQAGHQQRFRNWQPLCAHQKRNPSRCLYGIQG